MNFPKMITQPQFITTQISAQKRFQLYNVEQFGLQSQWLSFGWLFMSYLIQQNISIQLHQVKQQHNHLIYKKVDELQILLQSLFFLKMGPRTSVQIKQEAIRKKIKIQVEDIYCMFDETIQVVRQSKFILHSNYQQKGPLHQEHAIKSSKISNLQQVLDQLLQSFTLKQDYIWGKDIHRMFKKHFKHRFQQMWPINKEEFFKIVLSNCNFQTIDLKKQLQEIAQSMDIHELPAQRQTYQRYFYDVGAVKIQEKLPSSFVGDLPWQQSVKNANQKQTLFNMNAINQTIIKAENQNLFQKKQLCQPQIQFVQVKQSDFLPLFINTNSSKKGRVSQNPINQMKKRQNYNDAKIQNVSVIAPETVFYQRLTKQNKAQISDLVKFYRQFSNALEQMFFSSTSLVSAPYKHFVYCLDQKMKRKNLTNKSNLNSQSNLSLSSSASSVSSKRQKERLLYSQTNEGKKFRQRRQYNNDLILQEIKEFAQAYTDFVWMFLQLSQICDSRLGKLLNIYTLYGIVVKSIWKFVQWISDRGCEYQQVKIQRYYQNRPVPNNPKINIDKKNKLINFLKTLVGEKNPQKYLKKIVIFYRQANKLCTCADELLSVYEQIQGLTKQLALFRMPVIIQKLLKLEQQMNFAGQISYSWTSWCIMIQILKGRIGCAKKGEYIGQKELDYEEVVLES